jgi:hypothetical protein
MKMICAALQAPQPSARKPSANQRANQAQINAQTKRKSTRKPSANQRANQAQINAQIIFPRTSVASEMARKPFCQLRTSFCLVAQPFCP